MSLFLIGKFKEVFIIFSLLIAHETGHFITALLLKINIDKIYIYPYGGISKFNIEYNELLCKELLILIMGPLLQLVFTIILESIFKNAKELINTYSTNLIIFNMLPIYPLDGGKLINIILSTKLSFKKSLILSIRISYIAVFILFLLLGKNYICLTLILTAVFLLYKINTEEKNISYKVNSFLLERYLGSYKFKKRKEVTTIYDFRRNNSHLIKKNGKYYTEKSELSRKFKKNN